MDRVTNAPLTDAEPAPLAAAGGLDLAPPHWINMGAMAISTLAGSLLIVNAPDAPLLPFIKGFTVLYWATGTWWIPMLVVLAIWRYGYALSAQVRPALLGRGVSARHVLCGHARDGARDGPAVPGFRRAGASLRGARRVGRGVHRACAPAHPARARTHRWSG